MATLARMDVLLGINSAKFFRDLKSVQRRMRGVGRELERMGRGMTYGITVPTAAATAAVTRMAATYDESLTKIIALVGVSAKQVDQWGKEMLDLAPKVGKVPRELADAMYFITSAQIPVSKAMDTLTISAKASAAGLGETAVAADLITSAMNAYAKSNMTAEQAASVLVGTVREGKAYAEDLAPVMGKLFLIGSQLNVKFDDLGASMATLTRLGVPAAEASTAMRMVMSALVKPTSKAGVALASVGMDLEELRRKVADDGLLPTLISLKDTFAGSIPALAQVFTRLRAFTGVLGVTGDEAEKAMETYKELMGGIDDLGTAYMQTASRSMHRFRQVQAGLQASMIRLGYIVMPYVLKVAQKLGEAIAQAAKWFERLSPAVQKSVLAFVGILAVAGPLILSIGLVVKFIGMIGGATILAAAAVVGAAILIGFHWDKVKEKAKEVLDFLGPVWSAVANNVGGSVSRVVDNFKYLRRELAAIVGRLRNSFSSFFSEAGVGWDSVLVAALTAVLKIGTAVAGYMTNALGAVIELLNGDLAGAWERAKMAGVHFAEDMKGAFLSILPVIKMVGWKTVEIVSDVLAQIAGLLAEVVGGLMARAFDPVTRFALEKVFNAIRDQQKALHQSSAEAAIEATRVMEDFSRNMSLQMNTLATAATNAKTVTTEVVMSLADIPEKNPMKFDKWGEESAARLQGGFGRVREAARAEIENLQVMVDQTPIAVKMQLIGPDGNIIDTGGNLP